MTSNRPPDDEAARWRRRYERERTARQSAERLAADTMARLHLQLEAANSGEARSLDQQKADFLSVISHELRTPLTILRGGLHVLERHAAGGDRATQQVLGTVTRASDRLVRIVQNVEVSSRLRDQAHQWGLGLVDVDAVASGVADEIAPGAIVVDDPDHASVLASHELLRAALANLLQNAVTYGRAPFRVEVREVGTQVRLLVIDHGDGLPEDRADLFRDFSQGDVGDRRTSRGVGLGLSIVVGAAIRGGWHLEHRRVDDRTIFELRLPGGAATRQDLAEASADASEGSPPDPAIPAVTLEAVRLEGGPDRAGP